MLRRIQSVLWIAVLAAPVAAAGQTTPAPKNPPAANPPNPSAQSAPAATPDKPAAAVPPSDAPPANPFAFPEEDSKKKEIPALHDAVPDAPAPSAPAGADEHPYPGDVPASGGFSSSSDNAPGNPSPGSTAEPPSRHKLELHDAGSSGHVDTARADKDLSVADFYIKDGNYAGAYLRYKDAIVFDPDDADAHFGLAEMARKTGKPAAEAIEQYNAGLKLDPKNKHAKDAKKALAELQSEAAKK